MSQFRLSTWFVGVAILAWWWVGSGPVVIVDTATPGAIPSWRWGPEFIWPVRLLAGWLTWKAARGIVSSRS
ncbi:MAG: hypothetical protein JNG90_07695 [Planctomycetaceae bacterium]|nr:hypothetical protein [Planctomycetaceae bacterium]